MNEKIENLLSVSMEVTKGEREKNPQLSAGYDSEEETWEFVIKYTGKEEELAAVWPRPIVFLYHQYAISRGRKEEIETFAGHPQVEWVEKPKFMEYAVLNGIRESCISPVTPNQGDLTGKGVLIAIIDSGIDIFHPDFRKEDGRTRIIGLWDQTGKGQAPKGYYGGAFYDERTINEALLAGKESGLTQGRQMVSSEDLSGHGTHVAGIAAGNGRGSKGRLKGVAPEAELLIVKLGTPKDSDFPRTTQVMTGINFAVGFALERNMPLVINLSLGNNYGAHDGTTLLETYMSQIAGMGQITIVTGMGNQGTGELHANTELTEKNPVFVPFLIGEGERGFGLQIWKNYADIIWIGLLHPSGKVLGPFYQESKLQKNGYGKTKVLVYFGEPVPYRVNQEIYVTFYADEEVMEAGEWNVIFYPEKIVSGQIEMWLPGEGLISNRTKFLKPAAELTQTIPSTADKVISVGAYDGFTNRLAPFSGRGRQKIPFMQMKPDLVAPGVNIESCAPGGGYAIKSGTSMAVPFVSGSSALMMEWGIIKGNDKYLYGEKIKAYLRRGARKLLGYDEWPNESAGYGKLCLEDSFPKKD